MAMSTPSPTIPSRSPPSPLPFGPINMKRFVIQDSFTMVTTDGEPHVMMTVIASLSGLMTAILILSILVCIVSCKKGQSLKPCKDCRSSQHRKENKIGGNLVYNLPHGIDRLDSKQSLISRIFRRSSTALSHIECEDPTQRPRLVSISCISKNSFDEDFNTIMAAKQMRFSDIVQMYEDHIGMDKVKDDGIMTVGQTIIELDRHKRERR